MGGRRGARFKKSLKREEVFFLAQGDQRLGGAKGGKTKREGSEVVRFFE